MEGVRCVGNYNADKHPAWPRMHNKFLVFCADRGEPGWPYPDEPECVWTGSYNMTFNAQKSFENSVIIHDRDIAAAYAWEWSQILAFSEPLDWESRWCAPEYRIGT
jgi:phosphatidylserine/phosphatidylglycerophosphate/cardiolipin synthase-like enzyme